MRRAVLAGWLFLAPWVHACGASDPGATPESAVAALASALRHRRYADAYALMSADYRQRVSEAAFVRHLESHEDEAQELAASLARYEGRAEQTATVSLGGGEATQLLHEDGAWRFRENLANYYDQSTPRAALRAFVRAVERRRYDVLLQLAPQADRAAMTEASLRATFEGEQREEVEQMIASLRGALDSPIEVVGDRATMAYGEQGLAELVLEQGAWRIESPE